MAKHFQCGCVTSQVHSCRTYMITCAIRVLSNGLGTFGVSCRYIFIWSVFFIYYSFLSEMKDEHSSGICFNNTPLWHIHMYTCV